jgi:hypothetical protein
LFVSGVEFEERVAHVDVSVYDFPGRGAGYFHAVDCCCCVGHVCKYSR